MYICTDKVGTDGLDTFEQLAGHLHIGPRNFATLVPLEITVQPANVCTMDPQILGRLASTEIL